MEDQSKFFNVIIDKTNQKLNSFQAQIIVLESQLQMANDERDTYKKYAEEIPAQTLSASDLEIIKNNYLNMERQLNTALQENTDLKNQNLNLESNINSGSKFIKDQNETLLQEVRRLQRLVDELS
jgi:multidrug resistance efflux pump